MRGTLAFAALDIDRRWGREPGWFASLSRETKAELLAYRRVCIEVQSW